MIELVVVMVVVGIMAVVAVPRFNQLSGYKDVGYRDQVKSVLAYARKAAVARRRFTCVVFDGTSKATLTSEITTPDLHAGVCPATATAAYTALHLPSGANTLSPPANITITSPGLPLTIQFNAQGVPTVGGGAVITISDSASGTTSTLTLEAESGYVH